MTEYTQGIVALVLVIAVIAALGVLARRYLPQLRERYRSQGPLMHLGTLALSPQCSVALVQAGQETLILGLTPHAVTLLGKAGETTRPADRSEGKPTG